MTFTPASIAQRAASVLTKGAVGAARRVVPAVRAIRLIRLLDIDVPGNQLIIFTVI